MIEIDIIYGTTCPNANRAVYAVKDAVSQLGADDELKSKDISINTWEIPDSGNPFESGTLELYLNKKTVDDNFKMPKHILGWPSPTILINRQNVLDIKKQDSPLSSCSVLIPSKDEIIKMIEAMSK
jgi:hypothetical protein